MKNGTCARALATLLLPALAGATPRSAQTGASCPDDRTRALAEGIAQRECVFRPVAGEAEVWSAPSRAQGVRLRVSRAGLEVAPRAPDAEAWTLHLRTSGFGREGALREAAASGIEVRGARAELELGELEEWLENGAHGLEQGWTIHERAPGAGALWIELALSGDLHLRIDDDGRGGTLVDARGEPRLLYRDLAVADATGRSLPARLEPGPTIRIDDGGAVYPLTVDPLLTSPTWSVEGEQVGAHLGIAVATAGDVNGDGYSDVLVGASGYDNGDLDEGAALLYLGSSSGLALTPAWTVEGDQAGAHLGAWLGPAGDVNGDGYGDVVVCAPDATSQGQARVYLGSAAGLAASPVWSSTGKWRPVCTAGDVNGDGYSDVLLGAPLTSSTPLDHWVGRAVVYLGSAAGPELSPAWSVKGNQDDAQLGTSVAPAGDVNGDGYDDVVVGVPFFDQTQADEGQVRVYLGSASGLATIPAWTAFGGQADARLGASVASAGDVNGDGYGDVVMGAPGFSDGETGEGRAFLYLGSSAGLGVGAAWTVDGNQPDAGLGSSVAGVGDVNGNGRGDVAIGVPGLDLAMQDEGSVWLYAGTTTGLTSTPFRIANGTAPFAAFGASVGPAGDVNGDGYGDWIAGAPDLEDGDPGEGGAFLFQGAGAAPNPGPTSHVESNAAGIHLGDAVAMVGDVDGDGYDDVLAGAPRFHGSVDSQGLATLLRGTPNGMAGAGSWIEAGPNQLGAAFGFVVGPAGDVNGDGFDDLLVADQTYLVHLYLGSASGPGSTAVWSTPAYFAGLAATRGDVNGDGFADVAVGSHALFGGGGGTQVFEGSPDGLATTPDWSLAPSSSSTLSLAMGDVNGDGYSDLVQGTFVPGVYSVTVYHGSAAGLASTPATTLDEFQADSFFGFSVACAGDVDGDGYADVVVGAMRYDVTLPNGNEGAAYLYLGSPTGLSSTPAATFLGDQAHQEFGQEVAGAGDLNGDGYSDVAIRSQSQVFVYFGSATGLSTAPGWIAEGVTGPTAIAGGGDLNGDGYADLVIGSGQYSGGQPVGGAVFAFLGNEGAGGRLRRLQQRTRSGNRPIAHLGATLLDGQFRVRTEFLGSPVGLGWITPEAPVAFLEWEVKPFGQPFDGSGLERSPVGVDLGVPGAAVLFDELATTRLDPPKRFDLRGALFHWRARVVTNNPLQPTTAWFTPSGLAPTEGMLHRADGRLR